MTAKPYKKAKRKVLFHKILTIIVFPLHIITVILHKIAPKNKKLIVCIVGLLLAISGVLISAMTTGHFEAKHLMADFVGYAIHGFGLAPTFKWIAEVAKIEI